MSSALLTVLCVAATAAPPTSGLDTVIRATTTSLGAWPVRGGRYCERRATKFSTPLATQPRRGECTSQRERLYDQRSSLFPLSAGSRRRPARVHQVTCPQPVLRRRQLRSGPRGADHSCLGDGDVRLEMGCESGGAGAQPPRGNINDLGLSRAFLRQS